MTSAERNVWVAALYGPHPQPASVVRPAVILRERTYHRQPKNGGDVLGYEVRYVDSPEKHLSRIAWVAVDMVWPRGVGR